MPERIQLRRTAGWRKPEGAVVVSRPGRWGNPFLVSDVYASYPSLTEAQAHVMVVQDFRGLVKAGRPHTRRHRGYRGKPDEYRTYSYPSIDEIRAELAGHDLACWCPLIDEDTGERMACHADVLLVVADGGDPWDVPIGWPEPQRDDD